ncbi:MAG TPA: urease accessory protein UreD [Beijerinckiaceae bacterium]|nr:urease accessory protein UreD [Beijerinckiaceae bacterium]
MGIVQIAADASARARGEIRAAFAADDGCTHLGRLFETGGLRLRFPKSQRGCEAVIVNTAGGMAEGDCANLDFSAGPGVEATIATQAAERIYRGDGPAGSPATEVSVSLRLGEAACLRWLPQETILFDRARLSRRLDVDLAPSAALIIFESFVFGRLASGETRTCGMLRDRWRVRRAGRLAFAEDMRLEGAIGSTLDRPACGGSARACATLLYIAPDAEGYIEEARARLRAASRCEWGASAWNGMLVVRLLSNLPEALRAAAFDLLDALPGGGAPRVWR